MVFRCSRAALHVHPFSSHFHHTTEYLITLAILDISTPTTAAPAITESALPISGSEFKL